MFSLLSKDLDEAEDQNESGTRLIFAQNFAGEDFSRPHSFHTEIQLQKRILGEALKRCLQGCIPLLVDESFSSPTRKEPISDALKARNQSREGIGTGWTGFQASGS